MQGDLHLLSRPITERRAVGPSLHHGARPRRSRFGIHWLTHAPSRSACEGKDARGSKGYSVLTRRKPTSSTRRPGEKLLRAADRTLCARAFQLPPRRTRCEPVPGPRGSFTVSTGYIPYQSAVHSHTFPSMSCNPHPFARFSVTGFGRSLLFHRKRHATSFNFP